MTKLFRLKEWLKYQIFADTVYNIHSPFLFDFWQNVIQAAYKDDLYSTIILPILRGFYMDKSYIQKYDLGTGKSKGVERVSYVAKTSSIRAKYGHILHQTVRYFKPRIMIELGTCLGISTRYLYHSFEGEHFYSIEGSPQRLSLARTHLFELDTKKFTLCQGDFDTVLPILLEKHPNIDLAFIDGNHTFRSTQRYFNLILPCSHANTVLIFDDIHWSRDMYKAWEYICTHPKVTLTLDLFQIGICFFNSDLSKQRVILRY
ncbi:MAG: class I SAM-dependent methyltransferase [Bacteroidia bacterium]|nr:class I SAM-dependent methyltransferase [Bacteroidia bacterium]MDW8348408.1 class I SAM-dependent methyltransferase [Bacteroidia bacterium]